jgi:hypothetical protein
VTESHEILDANDPEAYERAAERVTADPDDEFWVVEQNFGDGWRVAAVLGSYAAADAYIEDARDFGENCPADAPEDKCRTTVSYRHGGRKSPTKFFESWPPEVADD